MSFTYDTKVGDDKDHEIDDNGALVVDETVATKVHFRLTCRRGQYWADVNMGSRLHTIKRLTRDTNRQVEDYAKEALQPLIDANEIIGVEIEDVVTNVANGTLYAAIRIEVAQGDYVDLGLIKLGS